MKLRSEVTEANVSVLFCHTVATHSPHTGKVSCLTSERSLFSSLVTRTLLSLVSPRHVVTFQRIKSQYAAAEERGV